MNNPLKKIVEAQKSGKKTGIWSCCSANAYVIKAALLRGLKDHSCVLIESTANQCDQYGGYTGMTPEQFRAFVEKTADDVGFDRKRLFLGGDHLGPLTFAHKPEAEAMKEAEELIRCYVAAGFTKIHLDTSMRLADDDRESRLSDEVIARRGARLARVAEETYQTIVKKRDPEAPEPVYVIGSEVPIPHIHRCSRFPGRSDDLIPVYITAPHFSRRLHGIPDLQSSFSCIQDGFSIQ